MRQPNIKLVINKTKSVAALSPSATGHGNVGTNCFGYFEKIKRGFLYINLYLDILQREHDE